MDESTVPHRPNTSLEVPTVHFEDESASENAFMFAFCPRCGSPFEELNATLSNLACPRCGAFRDARLFAQQLTDQAASDNDSSSPKLFPKLSRRHTDSSANRTTALKLRSILRDSREFLLDGTRADRVQSAPAAPVEVVKTQSVENEQPRPPSNASKRAPWRKILYVKQDYPDNYVDSSFLAEMRKNVNVRTYDYWNLVCASGSLTQHFSSIVMFLVLFLHLHQGALQPDTVILTGILFTVLGYFFWVRWTMDQRRWWLSQMQQTNASLSPISASSPGFQSEPLPTAVPVSPWTAVSSTPFLGSPTSPSMQLRLQPVPWKRTIKGAVMFFVTLLGLTPILKTLTKDTSDDTIWALTFCLFLGNLLFHDYTTLHTHTIKFPGSVSLNAAIFASVLLASRLSSNLHVFALMSFSVHWFALFPILRRLIESYSTLRFVLLSLLLCIVATYCLASLSALLCSAFVLIIFFLTFICPYWLISIQKYKNEIRGPWDEARLILSSRGSRRFHVN